MGHACALALAAAGWAGCFSLEFTPAPDATPAPGALPEAETPPPGEEPGPVAPPANTGLFAQLGPPIASTPLAPEVTLLELAVEPSRGHLLVLAIDDGDGSQLVQVVERGSGELLRELPIGAGYVWGLAATRPMEALLSDGFSARRLDLRSGEVTPVAGFAPGPVSYLDGGAGDDLGADDVLVTMSCPPAASTPIRLWGGAADNRVLLQTVILGTDIPYATNLAFLPERRVALVHGPCGFAGANVDTGSLDPSASAVDPTCSIAALAHDATRDRLLIARRDGAGGMAVEEYPY